MSGLAQDLVAAGIETVFGYPGYPANTLLSHVDDHDGLRLIITSAEISAVSAAHAHWMVTGTPAAVVLSDGPGVESALAMLVLAVREGAGILVVLPGLLPHSRTGSILAAIGAATVDLNEWDATQAVALARRGHVVGVMPGCTRHVPPFNDRRGTCNAHSAIVLGPDITSRDLADVIRHTCPVITTSGTRLPEALRSRWLGPLAIGSQQAVFDLLGLGVTSRGPLAAVGCAPDLQAWLHGLGSEVQVVDLEVSGDCIVHDYPQAYIGPAGLPLFDVLLAMAEALPSAALVSDAGGSHKVMSGVGMHVYGRVVSTVGPTTMGWGPGAALGAALAVREPVVLGIGDGALALSGLQIVDWRRHGVTGVIVAAENGSLGSVRARLGGGYPQVTSCPLQTSALWSALEIPWRRVPSGLAHEEVCSWAAGIAMAGELAALVVDTSGFEVEETLLPSGWHWWDELAGDLAPGQSGGAD